MTNRIFDIDPMAAASYGMYSAVKKGKGSFEDFLLHYNSHEANEGNNDWLTKMMGKDTKDTILSSSLFINKLGKSNINLLSLANSSEFLQTKAEIYKLQLMQQMKQRGKL